MSQAEITSIATLISTIIVAIMVIYRNVMTNNKIDNTDSKVSEVRTLVNGNLDNIVKSIEQLSSIVSNHEKQLNSPDE